MKDENFLILAATLFLIGLIAFGFWWYPQKWNACKQLYSNQVARIICLSS